MTVNNELSSVTHTGNGSTTLWPYTFRIPDADNAHVGIFDIASGALTELTPADYGITGIGSDLGGEVQYPLMGAALTSAKRIVIWREMEYLQELDPTNQSPYYPETLEAQLDYIVMQIQQLAEANSRAFKVTQGSTATPDELIEQLFDASAAAAAAAGAAEASKVAAELAETNAETAETNAEAALAAIQAIEANIATVALPVGAIIMRFGPLQPGFLAWGEGGTFDRATYPQLAAWLDTNGASLGLTAPQIAAGTIPDWRDYSPRTAGGALGPAVGATQEDQFQGHDHSVFGFDGVGNVSSGGNTIRFVPGASASGGPYQDSSPRSFVRGAAADGTNGTPRTGSETRVKSFGVRWQIKAFGAVVDNGTVVLSALAASVNNLETHAIRDDVDQSAQSKLAANKVNILKNSLQAWEKIGGTISISTDTAQVLWTGLDLFKELRLTGSIRGSADSLVVAQASSDGGSSWLTSYDQQILRASGTTITAANSTETYMRLATGTVGSITARGAEIGVNFGDFNSASRPIKFRGHSTYVNETGTVYIGINGGQSSIAAGNALRLFFETGYVSEATLTLEGVRG